MNIPRLYNGSLVDNASLEVRINEVPCALDVHRLTTFPPRRVEMLVSTDAYIKFMLLLGGGGKSGNDYMRKEWEFTLSFAHVGVPTQITEIWKRVVIVEDSTKLISDPTHGSWSARRLTIEALSVQRRTHPILR